MLTHTLCHLSPAAPLPMVPSLSEWHQHPSNQDSAPRESLLTPLPLPGPVPHCESMGGPTELLSSSSGSDLEHHPLLPPGWFLCISSFTYSGQRELSRKHISSHHSFKDPSIIAEDGIRRGLGSLAPASSQASSPFAFLTAALWALQQTCKEGSLSLRCLQTLFSLSPFST